MRLRATAILIAYVFQFTQFGCLSVNAADANAEPDPVEKEGIIINQSVWVLQPGAVPEGIVKLLRSTFPNPNPDDPVEFLTSLDLPERPIVLTGEARREFLRLCIFGDDKKKPELRVSMATRVGLGNKCDSDMNGDYAQNPQRPRNFDYNIEYKYRAAEGMRAGKPVFLSHVNFTVRLAAGNLVSNGNRMRVVPDEPVTIIYSFPVKELPRVMLVLNLEIPEWEAGAVQGGAVLRGNRTVICSKKPVPDGWIKVDDYWSPTTCGKPNALDYNVTVIERYSNKKKGDQMEVCANAPLPAGWEEKDRYWMPTRCGHPTALDKNVKKIEKVQD